MLRPTRRCLQFPKSLKLLHMYIVLSALDFPPSLPRQQNISDLTSSKDFLGQVQCLLWASTGPQVQYSPHSITSFLICFYQAKSSLRTRRGSYYFLYLLHLACYRGSKKKKMSISAFEHCRYHTDAAGPGACS